MNMNYVTVATDASSKGKRAGYAYYIRDDNGTTKKTWRTVGQRVKPHKAEVIAMMSALKRLHSRNYPSHTVIRFYSDNMTVIKILQNSFSTTKSQRDWKPVIEMASSMIDGHKIEAMHVLAHTTRDDEKKYFMNSWCDKQAHKQLYIRSE